MQVRGVSFSLLALFGEGFFVFLISRLPTADSLLPISYFPSLAIGDLRLKIIMNFEF